MMMMMMMMMMVIFIITIISTNATATITLTHLHAAVEEHHLNPIVVETRAQADQFLRDTCASHHSQPRTTLRDGAAAAHQCTRATAPRPYKRCRPPAAACRILVTTCEANEYNVKRGERVQIGVRYLRTNNVLQAQ
jgi:hypothetical protein